jgi:hypothetical protein
MNAGASDFFSHGSSLGFNSRDCVDFVSDGPGDMTVRPLTGRRLELAKAERERILRWEEDRKNRRSEQVPDDEPKNGPQ